jgi:transcriptional regulator with XRE-family HTH domain
MKLGPAIKLIRTASGMKQKEIAAKLDVTANYLSLLENGKREPSISFLKRLANVLGVPVGLFFLWEEERAARPNRRINEVRNLLTRLEALYVFAKRDRTRNRRAV